MKTENDLYGISAKCVSNVNSPYQFLAKHLKIVIIFLMNFDLNMCYISVLKMSQFVKINERACEGCLEGRGG